MLNVVGMIKRQDVKTDVSWSTASTAVKTYWKVTAAQSGQTKPGRRQWAEEYGLFSKDFRKHGNQPSGSVSSSRELLQ
jgi:hypothetical protein